MLLLVSTFDAAIVPKKFPTLAPSITPVNSAIFLIAAAPNATIFLVSEKEKYNVILSTSVTVYLVLPYLN